MWRRVVWFLGTNVTLPRALGSSGGLGRIINAIRRQYGWNGRQKELTCSATERLHVLTAGLNEREISPALIPHKS